MGKITYDFNTVLISTQSWLAAQKNKVSLALLPGESWASVWTGGTARSWWLESWMPQPHENRCPGWKGRGANGTKPCTWQHYVLICGEVGMVETRTAGSNLWEWLWLGMEERRENLESTTPEVTLVEIKSLTECC